MIRLPKLGLTPIFSSVLLSTIVVAEPAQAFALLDSQDHPAETALESLETAARWSYKPGSVVDGVRGLGNGLEYSIAPDFCDRILPQFRDSFPPNCAQVKDSIQAALDQWAADHPALSFKNISTSLSPALPPDNHPEPWQGFGAEFDFFVLSGKENPAVAQVGGYARYWSIEEQPRLTNGQTVSGSTITSADIIINAETCFFFNTQAPVLECNHFQSLVLHEVGHALGLGHPDELIARNLDTDASPATPIAISCEQPSLGLQPSKAVDPNAAMNGYVGRPAPVLELTADDRGGLNFLYPPCAIAPNTIPLWLWGVSLAAGVAMVIGSLLFVLLQQSQKAKAR